jgi:hypothetical protein
MSSFLLKTTVFFPKSASQKTADCRFTIAEVFNSKDCCSLSQYYRSILFDHILLQLLQVHMRLQ